MFQFDLYPPSVKRLFEYRWKVLIIAQELALNPAVIWTDSSTVFQVALWDFLERFKNCSTSQECFMFPWVLFTYAGHGVFAAINPAVGLIIGIKIPTHLGQNKLIKNSLKIL